MTEKNNVLGTLKDGSVITKQSLDELIDINFLNIVLSNAITEFGTNRDYIFDTFNLDQFLRNVLYDTGVISAKKTALISKKYNSLDDNKTNVKKAYNAIKAGLKAYYSTNDYNKKCEIERNFDKISIAIWSEQSTNNKLRRAIWEQLKK